MLYGTIGYTAKHSTTLGEQMIYTYYEHFIDFWLPIYKRQVFKAKFNDEKEAMVEIKNNIMKNWHLDNIEKGYIMQQLGLLFLLKEDKC